MRYIFISAVFILTVFSFSACSYKHDNLYSGIKSTTEQGVANTKKSQIIENGKIKLFITVTYLDSIDKKSMVNASKEQFVVGIHSINSGLLKGLNSKNIKFKIDGNSKNIEVKKLDKKSEILKIIPASNPWNEYLLVETQKIDKNFIKFGIKISDYKEVDFTFEKDY